MKTLEVRRHSIRLPGDHLNQQGVTLARYVGEGLGPFKRIVTSTVPRAFETAVAMGFAVDEENKLMSSFGSLDVEKEAPWPQSFAAYAAAVRTGGAASKYANKLAKYYEGLMKEIADGQAALVINHGGVVELGTVACLSKVDFEDWGECVDYCEGARLFWEGSGFARGEVLRVSTSSNHLSAAN